jgi:hypothetical protein
MKYYCGAEDNLGVEKGLVPTKNRNSPKYGQVHKNINVPLILKVCGVNFLSREKHMMGHFERFCEQTNTFLTSKLS